ncbi:uncharacterized protein LOC129792087 isoform X2 [Lutzomyia longipalpis]|uniref:uncharacterized protein LOC129792087 isoform X2 n=1 Tax=Lutzomyia longipalpis TaxID=7200 RepID=UPI0024836515|nr:uncharacterized protein LOC129792087 isoform X2 [Lutzomyia longipalpis]XP_055686796.1 uncharacterized protein LOC129792087 isoform X2 [Lutzomyia longipalpis]XP_055686797.1 uncharacterized protein LOC129792087 isoform X2 [Lutzomyia longipalpis]
MQHNASGIKMHGYPVMQVVQYSVPPCSWGPPTDPHRPQSIAPHSAGNRKYIAWCAICGISSSLVGMLFLPVHFTLRTHTSTMSYFETIPTFVPATLLMLTGLCVISLAKRRNRYSYLIKLTGACALASALTCALVTVTTTVLHMSRLQALRECEYQAKTRTCTCYSVVMDSQVEEVDEGVRFVFEAASDCGIVHGSLYSCLRAVFGLSVAGVLVSVFTCMLGYQLLCHERKNMYWEQLELRCRSLYTGQPPPPGVPPGAGPSIIGTPRGGPCRCCEQCHSHRSAMPSAYPWDGDGRFWTPGQAGNFYSPNPGGDELVGGVRNLGQVPGPRNRAPGGWSWPRMPWQRNEPQRFRQTPSSPDSQYGFSNTPAVEINQNNPAANGGYSVIGGPPYGVWGPPPPYSDPNSPARRGRYQYIHPNACQQIIEQQQQPNLAILECHQHSSSTDSHSMEPYCPQQQAHRNLLKRQAQATAFKTKDNYENTPSDSDGPRDRFSNTLPVRKTKKRVEMGAKSIGSNQPVTRINVQNVFSGPQQELMHPAENEYHEPGASTSAGDGTQMPNTSHAKTRRIKTGVENSGFQNQVDPNIAETHEGSGNGMKAMEPTESEVYFADVSSCCNISVKNDNYYEDANQRRKELKEAKEEAEDYLAQRFGKRETSIRSRLPFPQMIPEDYVEKRMVVAPPRPSLMHKDISRQSMCSADSGEKTDFTDLSPATPSAAFGVLPGTSTGAYRDFNESSTTNFVASFPYSSNEQSQEAHRRSTKNLQQDVFLAPDAQYEVIKETNQFENTPLTLGYEHHHPDMGNYSKQAHFHKPKSPKNLNITPIKRQNIGTNISAIIQNLGGSDVGLLYPDSRREPDLMEVSAGQEMQQSIGKSDEWNSDHSDRRL